MVPDDPPTKLAKPRRLSGFVSLLSPYLIKVGEDTAADRPEPAMPGLKKVYGALVGTTASAMNTFLMGSGDLLLIAFAAAAPEDCRFAPVYPQLCQHQP